MRVHDTNTHARTLNIQWPCTMQLPNTYYTQTIVSQFQPSQNTEKELAKERAAQANRERGAASILAVDISTGIGLSKALASLNLYTKKTKAHLEESSSKDGSTSFSCTLHYKSCLREAKGKGEAASKNKAKQEAARDCMAALRQLHA